MENWWVLIALLAVMTEEALSMGVRRRWQSGDDHDDKPDLDDQSISNQGYQTDQGQLPNQGSGQVTSGAQSATVQACMRNCLVTSEYNPVCGTDNVIYTNSGRLTCARNCGVNVSLLRAAPCPIVTTGSPV